LSISGAAGLFRSENVLTAQDPKNRFGKTHKVYMVQLEANKTYEIDLISGNFDAYLYLVDPMATSLPRMTTAAAT